MSAETVGALLARCLRAAGVTRAFRAPGHTLPAPAGVEVVDVPDDALAVLLADADGLLSTAPAARPGLALLGGRRIRLTSAPGREVLAHPITVAAEVPPAVAGWTVGHVHSALELDLDLDLEAPAPGELQPLVFGATDNRLITLSPSLASLDIVLVVGSGVVRDGQLDGVAEAVRRTGARVVATPGAVGVLPIDDPAWAGVVGLQEDDGTLSGLAGAELVVLAGLDPVEAVGLVPGHVQVLEVEPWHLELMAHHWPDPASDPEPDAAPSARRSELVARVRAIADRGRAATAVPLHPVRAVADLASVLDPGDLIVVDPGPAALWLQRAVVSFPAGSVVVPTLAVHGFAAAAALVAGLGGRRAVAVVTAPADPATDAVLDLASALGVGLVCEVWGGVSDWSSPSEHRERLIGARHDGGVHRLGVPVDLALTAELIDLAGRVVAWTADPLEVPGSLD